MTSLKKYWTGYTTTHGWPFIKYDKTLHQVMRDCFWVGIKKVVKSLLGGVTLVKIKATLELDHYGFY